MPQLTDEEKLAVNQSLDKKLSQTLTPDEQQAVDNSLNKKLGGEHISNILPNYLLSPFRTKGDFSFFKNSTNLISQANKIITPLDENATEEQRLKQKADIDAKLKATSYITAYETMGREQAKKNGKEFVDLKTIAERYGARYEDLTEETLQQIYSHHAIKYWNETQDMFGAPSQELLNNQEFWRNCDPHSYRYLATKRNIEDGLTGWTGDWLRTGHQTRVDRATNLKQLNYTIDKKKADEDRAFAFDRWGLFDAYNVRKDEFGNDVYLYADNQSELVKDVASISYNMWEPVKNHPLKVTGAFVAGTVASVGVGALTKSPFLASATFNAIFSGIVFGTDTYDQSLAEQVNDIQDKNPNIETADIVNDPNIKGTALASSALEVVADTVLFGTGRILKPFTNVGGRVLAQAFGKVQKNVAKITTPTVGKIATTEGQKQVANVTKNTVTKRVFDSVIKPLSVEIPLNTATESVTEGVQAYIQRKAEGNFLGEDPNVVAEDAWKLGIQATAQALAPSAVISVAFMTPKTISSLTRIARSERALNRDVMHNAGVEIASNSPLAKEDNNVNASLIDANGTLQSRIYLDKNKVVDALRETQDNFTVDDCGSVFKDKFKRAKNGEQISLTDGEFSQLPQQVRDAFYPISTNKDGEVSVKETAQYLSDQKLDEIASEVNAEQAQLISELKKQREIERDINNQLKTQSKTTNIEQNNAIARVVSSFISSMAKVLEVDSLDLYNNNKITYINKARLNLGQQQSIDDKSVTGEYNPKTRTVTLNERSDFNSVFHETSHWFLSTLLDLSETNDKARELMQPLVTAIAKKDKKINVDKLNEHDLKVLNETFVAGFIYAILNGSIGQKDNLAFKGFRRFLGSLKDNPSLFTNFNRTENKAEYVAENFGNTYGYETLDEETKQPLINFLSALFQSDVQSEIQNMEYPLDGVISDIDKLGLSEELVKEIKDDLIKMIAEDNQNIKDINDSTTVSVALEMMVGSKNFESFIGSLKEKIDTVDKHQAEYKKFIDKLENAHKKFDSTKREQRKELKNTELYQHIESVKEQGLNKAEVEGLISDEKVKKELERKGLIKEDGEVYPKLTLQDIKNIPMDILNRMSEIQKDKAVTKEVAYCMVLAEIPTIDEKATAQAKQIIRQDFIDNHVSDHAKIVSVVAKAHERIGRVILNSLKKALKINKDSGTLLAIKTTAIAEVNNSVLSEVSEQRALSNAKRASNRRSECLAKGDKVGALNATQDEIYQNTKASYIAEQKAYVMKTARQLTEFVRKSKKNLQKAYDADLVKVIEAVLIANGIIKRKTIIDLEQLASEIKANDPTKAQVVDKLIKEIQDNTNLYTSYKNMSVQDAVHLMQTLEDLKKTAHDMRLITLNGKRILKENVVNEALDTIKDMKDHDPKLAGYDEKNGVVGTTKRKLNKREKVQDAWSSFSALTKIVETEFQKLDGKIFGGVFHGLYQRVKDSETSYKKTRYKVYKKIQTAFHKIKIESTPIVCRKFNHTLTEQELAQGVECDVANGEYDFRSEGEGTNGFSMTLGAKGSRYEGMTTLDISAIMLHMGTNYDLFLDNNIADCEQITIRVKRDGENLNKSNADIERDIYRAQHEYKDKMFKNWFNDMVKQEHITKEMFDYCITVWDTYKSLEPSLQKASMDIRGYRFQKAEGRTIINPFTGEEVEAGYVPALVNKDLKEMPTDGELNFEKLITDIEQESNFDTPTFLIDRSKNRRRIPLDLDFDKMVSNTSNVIRYATVLPAVHDVLAILNDPKLKKELDSKSPYLLDKVVKPWIRAVATMKTSNTSNKFMKALSKVNQQLGVAMLTMSLRNTLQQVSNVPTVIMDVGVVNFAEGLLRYAFNPLKTRDKVFTESNFMSVRMNECYDGINEIISEFEMRADQLEGKQKYEKFLTNVIKKSNKHALLLQKAFQNVLDPIAYEAGKAKARRMGLSKTEQIKFAEMEVRQAFGSFDISDVAVLNRGNPLMKVFAMFATYFYQMWRLAESRMSIAWRDKNKGFITKLYLTAEAYTFSMVLPAIIAEYTDGLFTGENSDDDDTQWYENRYVWAVAKMQLASFPFVGKVTETGVEKFVFKKSYANRYPIPTYDTLVNAGETTLKLYEGINRYGLGNAGFLRDIKPREFKTLTNAVSAVTGVQIFSMAGRVVSTGYSVVKGDMPTAKALLLEPQKTKK